jgi:DNA mismatch repair ATPase MutS
VGRSNAARVVRKLERLINARHERNKEWFYGPSLVLLYATQMCMAIEQWKRENGAALTDWLDAWADFEALNALAGYAYEHPDDTFPQLIEGDVLFEGDAIGHPLLPETVCIRNDVKLNASAPFYMVSGSNMTGKSTLLRTIGVNAILALAGAPVRARRLRLSRLSICASLSVGDSLLDGKSKFFAEVERVRQTMELVKQRQPVLFLIDEIFSGTNSRDRKIAAESVVRALTEYGAIGALSTHDLALTEIAELKDLHGVNVHMGNREGCDPLDFDYLLKAGVSREANALAIIRLVGIPV